MENKPQWITEVYKIIGGQDHLGLGSVSSDQILENLTPGIIALTPHPRYCTFYTFLLDEFWRRDLNRSYSTFIKFFRPREFIFSVGANLCSHPEHAYMHSIMGGRKTAPLVKKRQEFYNTDYNYIKNSLGGYGLYYRAVIRRLGWIVPSGPPPLPPVDAPTLEGKKAAEMFRETIKDTEYYKNYFEENIIDIPLNVIEEYINKACLCQLQVSNSMERNYALYYFIDKNGDEEANSRRKTFELFLDMAKQIQGSEITDDIFRQLLYYGSTKNGLEYKPCKRAYDIYLKWRLYQAREYYGFALNSMWYYFCNWGIKNSSFLPIETEKFWNHVLNELNFKKFSELLDIPIPKINLNSKYSEIFDWIRDIINCKGNFDEECRSTSAINEYRLFSLSRTINYSLEIMVLGMLIILSIIYLRFENLTQGIKNSWFISEMGGYDRLSLDYFIKSMKRKLKTSNISIIEIIKWMFLDFVIDQHLKIASNKLPENTFRFLKEGNKIFFFDIKNSTPAFNTSRFEAISTMAHELGLCSNFRSEQHSLKPDGTKIFNGELPQWNF